MNCWNCKGDDSRKDGHSWGCQRMLWVALGHEDIQDKQERCSQCGISFDCWYGIMPPLPCNAIQQVIADKDIVLGDLQLRAQMGLKKLGITAEELKESVAKRGQEKLNERYPGVFDD